jgi:hypothetical protein
MPRPEGPFERLLRQRPQRDPAPIIIGGTIAFLAIVIVLVFVFSSVLGGGGGDKASGGVANAGNGSQCSNSTEGVKTCLATMPALPPGLTAASRFFQIETEEPGVGATLSLPLLETTQVDTGLGFYTYVGKLWQRVQDVTLQNGGTLASGNLSPLPANLAVLKVGAQTYTVAASLPRGTTLHADAGRVQIISPRDYTPLSDGTVQGTGTDVGHPQGTLVIPTIVGSGTDTASVVNDILASETLRATHVQQIVTLVQSKGLDGIDLEYSSVDVNSGTQFTSFVTALSGELHRINKKLILTLPPPTNQRSPYEWDKLGEQADYIKVLPIADPVSYWATMPNALSQIVQQMDPHKVLLVISPFSIQGSSGQSQPVGYLQAMVLASTAVIRDPSNPEDIKPGTVVKLVAKNLDDSEGATSMAWDEDSLTVSFALGGTERQRIYVENSYSVSFKLELVQSYGLGGLAVSDGSAESDVANVWPTVRALVTSGTVSLVRPNDLMLQVSWQSPDASVVTEPGATNATWTPHASGEQHVELIVSDGERRFGQQLTINVGQGDTTTSPSPIQSFAPTETTSPTPTTSASVTPTPSGSARVEVGNVAEGDDAGSTYSNSEIVSPGSDVTHLITIDNDSDVPVTVTSLIDDVYSGVTCETQGGGDIIGTVLAADDGDAPRGFGNLDGGADEIYCTFVGAAPEGSGTPLTDNVSVIVEDDDGNTGTDVDGTTVTTS